MSIFVILGVILLILILIGCIPVGVDARYEEESLALWVKIGAARPQILPPKEKKPRHAKKKLRPAKNAHDQKQAEKQAGKKKFTMPKLTLADIRALLELACNTLGELRQKIRVEELTLHVCLGAQDAAKAAMNYGRCWAALGALTPMLERLFVIKKRDIQPILDYNETGTKLTAHLALTITIGRALALALRAGARFVRLWVNKKKAVQKT